MNLQNNHSALAGKTALVTGGARRLGASIVTALSHAGARCLVHYHHSQNEAESLVADIRKRGGDAHALQGDLSLPDEVDRLFDAALLQANRVDVLINNASFFKADTLSDFSADDFAANMAVHALAPALLGRRLAAQDGVANIVNMLDARMLDHDAEHLTYHLSKRTLNTLTRIMALEFAPRVRVNAVAPGLILPPEGFDESYLLARVQTNSLEKHGTSNDVVAAVMFLLTNDFITGQTIFVDGGRHLRGAVYGG